MRIHDLRVQFPPRLVLGDAPGPSLDDREVEYDETAIERLFEKDRQWKLDNLPIHGFVCGVRAWFSIVSSVLAREERCDPRTMHIVTSYEGVPRVFGLPVFMDRTRDLNSIEALHGAEGWRPR
jgi:hypothetical protein